jgi:hypothetical protein
MRFLLLFSLVIARNGWALTPETLITSIEPHPSIYIAALGTADGMVSFVDLTLSSTPEIRRISVGSAKVIDVRWNPLVTDVLAALVADNRVLVRRFSDMSTMASSQSKLLRHTDPLLSLAWDSSSGSKMLVGTARGYIDLFTVSFVGISGPSDTSINQISDRTHQWFVGCRASFVHFASNVRVIAGCEEGEVWSIPVSQSEPDASIIFPRSKADPSPKALFVDARGYVIALFDDIVHVIDTLNFVTRTSFKIRPARGHYSSTLGEKRILSIDVSFASNVQLDKLIVRTTEGVIYYDLAGILGGTIPTSSWLNGTTLTDLLTTFSGQVVPSIVQYGDVSNDPLIVVNITAGALDVTACRNTEAIYKINEVKSEIHCTLGTPVVGIDIVLPFSMSHIEGEFKLKSIGAIPAMDCSAMKGPIINWSADQKNQWIMTMPSTRVIRNDAACPEVSDSPLSGPITNLAECKSACTERPECNMIFVKYRSDSPGTVEVCIFHRCESPENAPAPSGLLEEIWTLSSAYRAWIRDRSKPMLSYNGYVAIGTEKAVIHGGCAGPDGLIPTWTNITVPLQPTQFENEGSSVIRMHVSQFNAEAKVRLFEFNLNILKNYTDYESFYEEPSSAPGGYLMASPLARGAPEAPIAWTSLGVLITTSDTSVALINN